MPERLSLGVITGAHGINGAVKVRPYTQRPQDLTAYGPLTFSNGDVCKLKIERLLPKGMLIARIEGVNDRNAAENLQGFELFADRDKLPELPSNEFYIKDLENLEVRDSSGKVYGHISAIHNHGAGDFFDIKGLDGVLYTLPFTQEAVLGVEKDHILIEPSFLLS